MPIDNTSTLDADTAATDDDANESLVVGQDDVDSTGVDAGSTDAVDVDDSAAATDGSADSQQADADAWKRPFEELGFQNLESPEQAHQRLIEAYRRREEDLRHTNEQYRSLQAIHSRIDAISGGTQQQPASQAENLDTLAKLTSDWVEPDRELLAKYVTTNEEGVSEWRADTPAELRKQVEQYQLKQNAWHKVVSDPRQFEQLLNQRLEKLVTDRLQGELAQREQRQTEEQFVSQFTDEHSSWIYAADPVTGHQTDRLTRDGERFQQFVAEARSLEIPTSRGILSYALARTREAQAQARSAPVEQRQSLQPVIQDRKLDMLGRKKATPSRQTTAAGVSDGAGGSRSGQSRESWGRMLVNDLAEEGHA